MRTKMMKCRRVNIPIWKYRLLKCRTNNREEIVFKSVIQYRNSGDTMSGFTRQLGSGMEHALYFKSSVSVRVPASMHRMLLKYNYPLTSPISPCGTKPSCACVQGIIYSKPNDKVKMYVGLKTHAHFLITYQKTILFQNHPT